MTPEERAAEALRTRGFTAVRAVPVAPDRRTADLVAERGGERWAVEVRSSTRPLRSDGSFLPKDEAPLPYPTLASYCSLCWLEKRGQLEATMAAETCARGLLLIEVQGEASPVWERALQNSWLLAGQPRDIHFGLFDLESGAFLAAPSLPKA